MKRVLLMLALLTLPFQFLTADIRKCRGNDTISQDDQETVNLLKYLKGSWNIQGTWHFIEGEGKTEKNIKSRLTGTEVFSPILNGHFLQKNLSAKIKYHSVDLDKNEQTAFSSLTILTFNGDLNQYFSWYYDCSGSYIESTGEYDKELNQYRFLSQIVDEKGGLLSTLYTLTIVDKDHYSWQMQEKKDKDKEWTLSATGSSTRKNKS